jgi:hypothetical protein
LVDPHWDPAGHNEQDGALQSEYVLVGQGVIVASLIDGQ